MDASTIAQLADAIAARLPTVSYAALAAQCVLLIIAAATGAYFGEWLKTRGKDAATNANFPKLFAQLEKNTELVENIKAEIGRSEWAAREWANVRRLKLERTIDTVLRCEDHLDIRRRMAPDGNYPETTDPINEYRMLLALYFPELQREGRDYSQRYSGVSLNAMNHAIAMRQAEDFNARATLHGAYMLQYQTDYRLLSDARDRLYAAAKELMLVITLGQAVVRGDDDSTAPTYTD